MYACIYIPVQQLPSGKSSKIHMLKLKLRQKRESCSTPCRAWQSAPMISSTKCPRNWTDVVMVHICCVYTCDCNIPRVSWTWMPSRFWWSWWGMEDWRRRNACSRWHISLWPCVLVYSLNCATSQNGGSLILHERSRLHLHVWPAFVHIVHDHTCTYIHVCYMQWHTLIHLKCTLAIWLKSTRLTAAKKESFRSHPVILWQGSWR